MSGISGPGVIPLSGGGNLIGVANDPTISAATGLWSLPQHFKARGSDDWPFVIAGYVLQAATYGGTATRQISRISESDDTATLRIQVGTWPTSVQGGVFSSEIKGYYITSGGILNALSFASETIATGASGSGFPDTNRGQAASAQSTTDGYAFGGRAISLFATSFKWAFSTDARTATGNLPGTTYNVTGSMTATDAYAFGGSTSGSTDLDAIRKMPFSTETWSTIGATLSVASQTGSNQTAKSSNSAYLQFDRTSLGEWHFNRFDFSAETITTLTPITPSLNFSIGYSSPVRAGIVSVGFSSTTVRFLDFATEDYIVSTSVFSGFTSGFPISGGLFSQV